MSHSGCLLSGGGWVFSVWKVGRLPCSPELIDARAFASRASRCAREPVRTRWCSCRASVKASLYNKAGEGGLAPTLEVVEATLADARGRVFVTAATQEWAVRESDPRGIVYLIRSLVPSSLGAHFLCRVDLLVD